MCKLQPSLSAAGQKRTKPGIETEPGVLAVDRRIHAEPVFGADGLHAQTADQDVKERFQGIDF